MISYQLAQFGQPLHRTEGTTPSPTGDEVLLRVSACGVCHSDVHLYDGFFDLGEGQKVDLSKCRQLPLTLGHEISGEVVAVGPTSRDVSVGDQRVVYPWLGCGACAVCADGHEHLCSAPRSLGVVRDGGFADHVMVPHARYLFDLAAVEPALACTYACSGLTAYSALMKVSAAAAGRHLLLIGAGGVGLAALSLARTILDATVMVADIETTRLQAAREAGPVEVIDPTAEGAAKRVRQITGGGAVATIDFVGSTASASFGLDTMGVGGTLVIVGLFGGLLPVRLPLIPLKQLTVRGSFVGSLAEMRELIDLVGTGQVPPITVRTRPLDEAQAALCELRDGRGVGRTVLVPAPLATPVRPIPG